METSKVSESPRWYRVLNGAIYKGGINYSSSATNPRLQFINMTPDEVAAHSMRAAAGKTSVELEEMPADFKPTAKAMLARLDPGASKTAATTAEMFNMLKALSTAVNKLQNTVDSISNAVVPATETTKTRRPSEPQK